MPTHLEHLQAILDAATDAAKALPSAAAISAVEKARKALDDYAGASAGEKFPTQTAALEYLQRTWQIEKSKLSKDVKDAKVPRKDGFFHAKDLDFYASAVHLKPKTVELTTQADPGDRLKAAHADEREFRLGILRGQYIDAAEEEARDARLWAAIKSDLENHAPTIINELINRIMPLIEDEDIKKRLHNLTHDLRITYEDTLADIFDRYARDGGVEE